MTTSKANPKFTVIHFAGRAGDHNDRAMAGSPAMARELSTRLGVDPVVIGEPEPAQNLGWRAELVAAHADLTSLKMHLDDIMTAGRVPVTALSRCAVASATLPVVARHRPDAVVVWFDAHADLNTPATTGTGYLGGLALAAPLGLWNSGFGAGLSAANTILAGTRDLDTAEQDLIDHGLVTLVQPGPDFAMRLSAAVGRRPVYVDIDCDVLKPGIVPTDYQVPGGLTLDNLHEAARVLSTNEIVGLEVGEFEADTTPLRTDAAASSVLDALRPLLGTTYSAPV